MPTSFFTSSQTPGIYGIAYARRDDREGGFHNRIWCLYYDDPAAGGLGWAVTFVDRQTCTEGTPTTPTLFGNGTGYWRLADSTGTAIPNNLEDIAYDSQPNSFWPAIPDQGFMWGVASDGTLYRWMIDDQAVVGSAWTATNQTIVAAPPGSHHYEGIALDTSLPTTIDGNWGSNQITYPLVPPISGSIMAGTLLVLDTAGSGGSVVRSVQRIILPQETFVVGSTAPSNGLVIGLDYSAEIIRIGSPCAYPLAQCGTGAGNTQLIDVQYQQAKVCPFDCSHPVPRSSQPINGSWCPFFRLLDLQWCMAGSGTTPYLFRSSAYAPTPISITCTLYPDVTTGTATAGTNPITIAPLNGLVFVPIDGPRSVEYAQWVFMCGGTGAPFSTTAPSKVSDACRITWSQH